MFCVLQFPVGLVPSLNESLDKLKSFPNKSQLVSFPVSFSFPNLFIFVFSSEFKMWFFKKRVEEDRIEILEQKMSLAFQKIKNDNQVLFEWIKYLHAVNSQQRDLLNDFGNRVRIIPDKTLENERLKRNESLINEITQKIVGIEVKITNLDKKEGVEVSQLNELKHQIELFKKHKTAQNEEIVPIKTQNSLIRQKIVKKLNRNSKSYIKDLIKSLIRKYGKISALHLRDMVVDEQALCSKSSFYRILEELEKFEEFEIVIDGKEKMFFARNLEKQVF